MKKAIIVTSRGGFINAFLLHDIDILQSLGYLVICCANDNGKGYIEDVLRKKNVKFYQVDFASKNPLSQGNIRAYKQLRAIFKQEKPDVIHVHTAISGVLTRFATMFNHDCVMVYTTHGFNFHQRKAGYVYRTVENLCSYFTDYIITINQEDYQNAKRMHAKHVKYIHGVGVDFDKLEVSVDKEIYRKELGISKEDIMVLSVGELSNRKNHQIIIKAIGMLKNPNIHYVIAGAGIQGSSTYDSLLQLAKEHNVNLHLLGFRTDIPKLCNVADIGALPSTQEGLGLSGIEQLRCGVPIVASDVQGIKDYVINDKNGYMYAPYDASGFSSGIEKLIDVNTRIKMKEFCKKSVEAYNCRNSYKEMEEIYTEIDREVTKKK